MQCIAVFISCSQIAEAAKWKFKIIEKIVKMAAKTKATANGSDRERMKMDEMKNFAGIELSGRWEKISCAEISETNTIS